MSNNYLQDEIKNWVSKDNEIKLLNERIQELRKNRDVYSNNILTYVETNNMYNSKVKISDSTLQFTSVKQQQTLTYKFLEICAQEYFLNSDKASEFIEFVKSKRESKMLNIIKRDYD